MRRAEAREASELREIEEQSRLQGDMTAARNAAERRERIEQDVLEREAALEAARAQQWGPSIRKAFGKVEWDRLRAHVLDRFRNDGPER